MHTEIQQEPFRQSICWFKEILFALSLVLLSSCSKSKNSNPSFKFNLPVQIYNADPQLTRGTAFNYALYNLHRGLLYYDGDDDLKYWGAKSCDWINKLKLECKLSDRYWHNGDKIIASDYVNSFFTLFISKNSSLEYLKNIEGFNDALNGDLEKLKITARSPHEIIFKFSKPDFSFLQKLTHLSFSPRKERRHYQNFKESFFSGPYKVESIDNSRIKISNNSFYDDFKRPDVEILIIDESKAALNLYESKKIDFLRFLPTHIIRDFNDSKLLYKSFLSRLDGIVLSKVLLKDLNLRMALSHSLDFSILKKIYTSESDPGCIPLPDGYFLENSPPCIKFDLKKAKSFFSKVKTLPETIKIFVPKIESNDHLKMAEWAQDNWKNHLGLKVQIEQLESKILIRKAKLNEVQIYRRGFNLSQSGCFFAIENFYSKAPSNFINYESARFDTELSSLKPLVSKETCSKLFSTILSSYQWIPTGRLYFSHLHSIKYTGYKINSLNQFDLSNLRERSLSERQELRDSLK